MKAAAIIGAIFCAFIAGVGVGVDDASERRRYERTIGAFVFLLIAISCGVCAWQR